jgi:hypothetical protein
MAGIDDDFWLEYAKSKVSKSLESRDEAAVKLDSFLSWLWVIYTSVFTLASLFNYMSPSFCQLVFVAQPIIIIMLARFFCIMVSMPGSVAADANVIPEIIEGYQRILGNKITKLNIAIAATFISMLSLSIAIVGYNYYDPDKKIKSDIQQAMLKKELFDKKIHQQSAINDSIKLVNEYYEYQFQNEIKRRKLDCLKHNSLKCVDSLKTFEK